MSTPLSFFNWSLRKALASESDSFTKARIRIIYMILLFSLLKILVALGYSMAYNQHMQEVRAVAALALYIILMKVMLYKPSLLKQLAHIMIFAGTLVVWSNVFVYAHGINLPTIQFVFMIVLAGFYVLGSTFGFIYSAASALPILIYIFFHNKADIYLTTTSQQIVPQAVNIIAVLNFISIVLAHYLFFDAFYKNIREKEALNDQLRLAAKSARELAASKSNFLSTMSHELRTPLNSVIGTTELLLDDEPEERQKPNLKILHVSALDLLSLINNILDFNKMDGDRPELEAIPFHLSGFMKDRCSVLALRANDKNLVFKLDIDKQLEDINIISDPTRLSQIIYNLVSNAIKFTDAGSVTVKLECTDKTADNVTVKFSVIDTGIGIDPAQHDTIFQLFTQAESHITRKYGGTGLGLAIVKRILQLFHSNIQLQSTPGSGASFFFTVTFPVSATAVETKSVAENKMDLSRLKILVAEDNDVNRLLVKKQMNKLGIDPVTVENGELAYEACLTDKYDAIFMDLHMPVMDGYEALKKIRALPDPIAAQTYIIAFTASVTEQEKIYTMGFNDFLYKPVNMSDLREKLERIALTQ